MNTIDLTPIAGTEFQAFLDAQEVTEREFSTYSPHNMRTLLNVHIRENEILGDDSLPVLWAREALDYLEKLENPVVDAPTVAEEIPLTVSAEELPSAPAEIILADAPTIVFETVEPEPPKVEKPLTPYLRIKSRLERLNQPELLTDFTTLVHEAIEGRLPIPCLDLAGYAGLGKSHSVNELVAELNREGETWKLVQPTSDITLAGFKKVIIDHFLEGLGFNVVLFLDEFHAFDRSILQFLKVLSETGGKVKEFTLISKGEEKKIVIDPRRHMFIVASNEPPKDSALTGASGRFKTLQFLPYREREMKRMIESLAATYLPGVDLSSQVITFLAKNIRPFGRAIKNALESLRAAIHEGYTLEDVPGCQAALAFRGYYPGGWRQNHLHVLSFLGKTANGRQVGEIAMGPMRGASTKQTQQMLAELMQGDLVITFSNGRKGLTEAGVKLLKKLEKAPAKK